MKRSPIPFSTLLTELADPEGSVRQRAIRHIMRRRSERGQAFASVLTLLNDPEESVCKEAIKALNTFNDPQAVPTLIQVFTTHQGFRVRLLALKTMVELDRQQALPHL